MGKGGRKGVCFSISSRKGGRKRKKRVCVEERETEIEEKRRKRMKALTVEERERWRKGRKR